MVFGLIELAIYNRFYNTERFIERTIGIDCFLVELKILNSKPADYKSAGANMFCRKAARK